jgi:hypothetical protein
VAYQPQGREFIVDIGPAAAYTGATGSLPVSQFTAADLAGVFGGSVPANLLVTVLGANGVDGYFATNGPASGALVGSALGASNQVRFLGGNFQNLSKPVSGNAAAGYFDFGDAGSYQKTLNAAVPGSIGNNVSFNVESLIGGSGGNLPFFSAHFNPFTGQPASQTLLGTFKFQADGTTTYLPLRSIGAQCVANPATLNPKAQGAGFSFSVILTDVTDPANPVPVPLSKMDPAYISQVGGTVLPVPFSGPACTSDQDGIWETVAQRLDPFIYFSAPSDGNCSILDGNRQDILAVAGRSTGTIPVCFASQVDGNPVACCAPVRVLDKARR